jgi:hypothetical protein
MHEHLCQLSRQDEVDSECRLNLVVADQDVVEELQKRSEAADRNSFALAALRVGVLAIRQASGVIDGRTIHQEGERLVGTLKGALQEHIDFLSEGVASILGKYFDPQGGELPQRIDRLIRRDGELESLLARHVNGDGSTLSHTLDKHLGPTSPLLKLLSPEQQQGLLHSLKESLQAVLAEHRRRLAGQFSLDDKESVLSRLISQVTEKNGHLRRDLAADLQLVRSEFSLDNADGALARLVGQFQQANRKILDEFSVDNADSALVRMMVLLKSTSDTIGQCLSLDEDGSPLSRLRREMLGVVQELKRGNESFHEEIRLYFETMKARRAEAARSTTHGIEFEAGVCSFIEAEARRLNDLFESTKDSAGSISRCKVGDCVLALGSETACPGARIVIEAKEDKSYDLRRVREDLRTARENRQADVGIFVWSKVSAPEGCESLCRWGNDIVVIWNPEDILSDVYLKAAVSLARLIVVQQRKTNDQAETDLRAMESSITAVTRELAGLDEIVTWATTAKNSGEKISAKANTLKRRIEEQLDALSTHISGLHKTASS